MTLAVSQSIDFLKQRWRRAEGMWDLACDVHTRRLITSNAMLIWNVQRIECAVKVDSRGAARAGNGTLERIDVIGRVLRLQEER
jgi:hypothetical protein